MGSPNVPYFVIDSVVAVCSSGNVLKHLSLSPSLILSLSFSPLPSRSLVFGTHESRTEGETCLTMSGRNSVGDLVPRDITEVLALESKTNKSKRKQGASFSRAFSWLRGTKRKSSSNGQSRGGRSGEGRVGKHTQQDPNSARGKGWSSYWAQGVLDWGHNVWWTGLLCARFGGLGAPGVFGGLGAPGVVGWSTVCEVSWAGGIIYGGVVYCV